MTDKSKETKTRYGFRKDISDQIKYDGMKNNESDSMYRRFCGTCNKNTPHTVSDGKCSWCGN